MKQPRLGILFSACLAMVLSGCQWQQPSQKSAWQGDDTQTAVNLPAGRLLEVARQAVTAPPLSMTVEEVGDGKLLTGWREYPGDIHIVRRWYERTRFRITVSPEFKDPGGKSRILVEDQTQERAELRQPWYPAPDTHRPERSKDVLNQILAATSSGK